MANGSKLHHGPSPYLSLGLGTIKSRKPTSENNYDNKNIMLAFRSAKMKQLLYFESTIVYIFCSIIIIMYSYNASTVTNLVYQ